MPDYKNMTAKEAATAIYTMGRTTWPPLAPIAAVNIMEAQRAAGRAEGVRL